MAPTSNRTLRIRGIPQQTSIEGLETAIESVHSAESRRSYRHPWGSSATSIAARPIYSFAEQNTFMTCTVSFASPEIKVKTIKRLADDHADWEVDDHFAAITVLSAPKNIDIE